MYYPDSLYILNLNFLYYSIKHIFSCSNPKIVTPLGHGFGWNCEKPLLVLRPIRTKCRIIWYQKIISKLTSAKSLIQRSDTLLVNHFTILQTADKLMWRQQCLRLFIEANKTLRFIYIKKEKLLWLIQETLDEIPPDFSMVRISYFCFNQFQIAFYECCNNNAHIFYFLSEC